MYAHHNTDAPEVLPCNRNNCRCGNDKNCMYYNNPDNAHYNYVSVHGTGDKKGPFYKCPSLAYDKLNTDNVYDDHAMNGLGGYDNLHPYDKIEGPRDWYGPAPLSYPEKGTCCGQKNPEAQTCHDNHDYDKWDRYHKYHAYHKVLNAGGDEAAAAEGGAFQMPDMPDMPNMPDMPDLPEITIGVDSTRINLTYYLMLGAGAAGLWYLQNAQVFSSRTALLLASLLVVFFFLQNITV